MIIYNVTINVEEAAHDTWLAWMQDVHLPEVMATGCFNNYRMLKVLTTQSDETGATYAIQYECESMADYVRYQDTYATELRGKTEALFGGQFAAFRTLLEVV